MSKLNLVRVPENRVDEHLDEFFNTSAFTFEGIDLSDKFSNSRLAKSICENGYEGNEVLGYYFTGKEMNAKYHLTDDNAYPDDLIFLVIPKFYNPMYKMLCGARWFDDIVQNNAYREAEKAGVM